MHIVICGFPRSGTTLLYNMLRSTVKDYEFYEHEMSALKFAEQPSANRITKRPFDFQREEHIRVCIPDVKFIVCIRDPRSILVSKHWHSDSEYKVSWDKSIRARQDDQTLSYTIGLVKIESGLNQVKNATYVFFEDLVSDPLTEQERLGKLFNFQYTDMFTNFHNHPIPEMLQKPLNGVRPVDTSRIDSWKQHPERIWEQFTACPDLHRILFNYRYEKNYKWLEEL